ncbi:hypothetical protein, partial [Aeromonas hydrophila]
NTMMGYRQQRPKIGLTVCPDLVDHYSLSESPINSGESNDEDGTTRKGNLQAAHGGIKLYNRWLC